MNATITALLITLAVLAPVATITFIVLAVRNVTAIPRHNKRVLAPLRINARDLTY